MLIAKHLFFVIWTRVGFRWSGRIKIIRIVCKHTCRMKNNELFGLEKIKFRGDCLCLWKRYFSMKELIAITFVIIEFIRNGTLWIKTGTEGTEG